MESEQSDPEDDILPPPMTRMTPPTSSISNNQHQQQQQQIATTVNNEMKGSASVDSAVESWEGSNEGKIIAFNLVFLLNQRVEKRCVKLLSPESNSHKA